MLPEALAYMREDSVVRRSVSWREKAAADIGMFYEFYRASGGSTEEETHANNLIANFLNAAVNGTIKADRSDPLELYWTAMSNQRASVLRKNLRFFLGFLDDFLPGNSLSATRFAKSSVSAFALERKKALGLLYHLKNRGQQSTSSGWQPTASSQIRTVKKFPREHLARLVLEGCKLTRPRHGLGSRLANEYNITMVLALSLLIGGGIRRSELFHIWVDDVQPAAGPAGKVYLYHPEEGVVSGDIRRKGHLLTEYGRVPRNKLPKGHKEHAGWKDLLADDTSLSRSEVYWCDPFWRDLFFRAFIEYRDGIRPDDRRHPYLFVSLADVTLGEPWTIGAFNQSFTVALARIGLQPDRNKGLNPHGIRHAYGQYLRNLELHPQFIQRAMHHVSPLSQAVYTAPEPYEVNDALEAVRRGVDSQKWSPIQPNDAFDLTLIARKDPAGVLAAWGYGS